MSVPESLKTNEHRFQPETVIFGCRGHRAERPDPDVFRGRPFSLTAEDPCNMPATRGHRTHPGARLGEIPGVAR